MEEILVYFELIPWVWLFILAAMAAVVHIIMVKDDEGVAIAWLGVVILSPIIGTMIYALFGINRIVRRVTEYRQKVAVPRAELEKGIFSALPTALVENARSFYDMGQKIHEGGFCGGNEIMPLLNGDMAYPLMLKAIEEATESIALATYIFDNDVSGRLFADALIKAHNRGVKVRILIDDMGIRYSRPRIDKILLKEGIAVKRFLPRKIGTISFINLRNHRKVLLIDGDVAFTGGMNIRNGNMLEEKPKHPIQDLHFMIKGRVIDQMNRIFEEDWFFAAEKRILLPKWGEKGRPGNVYARAIPHGPDNDFQKLTWLMIGALNAAHDRVRVISPYFLPNEMLRTALSAAAMRGVEVEVIVPEKNNLFMVDWAMQAGYYGLIRNGVKIYKGAAPFDHSKLMLVDGIWALIGSTNWDQRSLRLNFEMNLECVDPDFNLKMEGIFEDKKNKSKRIMLADLEEVPKLIRFRNRAVRLLSPYL